MRYVVFNRKGGVGKSTISCNLAAVAAAAGHRTLVVDLDPQANSTQYLLGREAAAARPALADFFSESLGFQLLSSSADSAVHATPFENLYLLPADHRLVDLQPKLEARYKIYKLRDLLRKLDDFDVVYLDTPPAVNFYTTSALIAADRCLIPFDCDDFSRRSLYELMGTLREVRDDHKICSSNGPSSRSVWWRNSRPRACRFSSRTSPSRSRSASPTRRTGRSSTWRPGTRSAASSRPWPPP